MVFGSTETLNMNKLSAFWRAAISLMLHVDSNLLEATCCDTQSDLIAFESTYDMRLMTAHRKAHHLLKVVAPARDFNPI